MMERFVLFAFADNFVVWGIVALALFCYSVELDLILAERDAQWRRQVNTWLTVLPILVSALPLLGLLGTVNGLLSTFRAMAANVVVDETTHEAAAVVLATGSTATPIPGVEFSERIVDTWGAWSLPSLPKSIAVVGCVIAGHSSHVAAMAGIRLPIESHKLQAFVSEGLKPMIDGVITFGAGHFYVSQSDKGGLVFGGDIDGYNSYAQRGNLPVVEDVCEGGMALMPVIGRVRLLRQWGGIMDMSMDGSPIIDRTPVDGLYLNAGWCYGGFKATPASGLVFAHLLARDEPHKEATRFRLDRFRRGAMIDEKGQGAQPNLH